MNRTANTDIVSDRFVLAMKYLRKKNIIKYNHEVGKVMGVCNTPISKMRTGKRTPTLYQLQAFIEHYGFNANYFFGKSNVLVYDVKQMKTELEPKDTLEAIDEKIQEYQAKTNSLIVWLGNQKKIEEERFNYGCAEAYQSVIKQIGKI